MRIRFYIPLPGPFVLVPSRRKQRATWNSSREHVRAIVVTTLMFLLLFAAFTLWM